MNSISTRTKTWTIVATSLLIVGALLAAGASLAQGGQQAQAANPKAVAEAVEKAVAYLKANQLPDGGIVGWTPGQADEFTTIKAVLALASAGYSTEYLTTSGGAAPLDYLASRAISYTHDLTGTVFPGRAGMLAVAAVAGDADPSAFGGMDLISELVSSFNAATGAYSTTAKLDFSTGAAGTLNQTWSVLALAAIQQPVPEKALAYLVGLQESDGGWGYGFGGDVDMTGLVIQALTAAGMSPAAEPVSEGLAFLRQVQDPSGAWASWGALSPDSTGAAMQGIAAVGVVPIDPTWAAKRGTPTQALLGMQAADGSFLNTVGTADAIPGLTQTPLPILGKLGRAREALSWLSSLQAADGSWASWSGGDPGVTSDAVLAYVAAGYDPRTVMAPGSKSSAMDYLAANAASFAALSPDRAGKLALAVVAGGADPKSLGGISLSDAIMQHYSSTVGAFGATGTFTNTWYQSLAIMGLAATGEVVPSAAVQSLRALQQPDGGWRYDLSKSEWSGESAENTSIALQGLIAAQVPATDKPIKAAISYLRAAQDGTGGWDGNANATATAIQGLLAAGEDPAQGWLKSGHSPYDALIALQKSDGPFVWKWDDAYVPPADNALATVQAVQALAGMTPAKLSRSKLVPFQPVPLRPDPDRLVPGTPTIARQDAAAWLRIPYGSDADHDATVDLGWQAAGATGWITSTAMLGAQGLFTATLPFTAPVSYALRITLTDPAGVQYSGAITPSLSLEIVSKPYRPRSQAGAAKVF